MEKQVRNNRKILSGTVTSRMGDKSIKVTVPYKIPHPRYQKVINRKTVLHVHDEKNETKTGDRVEIMETRPISRLKCWRIVKVLEVSPDLSVVAAPVAENEETQSEA
jgi:small subunit ribosomal protein S17